MYEDVCQCTHKRKEHSDSGCNICIQYVQLRTEKCKAFEQTRRESVCNKCKKYFNNPFGDMSKCAECGGFPKAGPLTPFVQLWSDEEDGYVPLRGVYAG